MHRKAHRETKPAEETRSDIGRLFRPSSAHCGRSSNRQTYGLLEMNVSCTKQREGGVSNRQCFALFPRYFVSPSAASPRQPARRAFALPKACPACPERSRRERSQRAGTALLTGGLSLRAASSGVNECLSMILPVARFTRARSSREKWHLLEFSLSRAKSVASKFLIDNFRALFQTLPRRLACRDVALAKACPERSRRKRSRRAGTRMRLFTFSLPYERRSRTLSLRTFLSTVFPSSLARAAFTTAPICLRESAPVSAMASSTAREISASLGAGGR